MDSRKRDPRVYVLSFLFFAFIVSGGVCLALYLFLPSNDSQDRYLYAGMTFVCVPWAFWLLIFVYRFIKPVRNELQQYNSSVKSSTTRSRATGVVPAHTTSGESPVPSPYSPEGARRVHFGGVVVISEDDNEGGSEKDGYEDQGAGSNRSSQEGKDSDISSESEIPLALSV
ncbi:hypothetical protein K2173_025610 [Erythroxylum novogranatense]|uniref:Uncharacterized protein n=1 Tax=Erythroxylum novogranatense TaxID=1862640 RepID=A0AAV8T8Z4_9ROSI|nr:hypothetical protein K2173_025610 [Erythroxylum novogranatense]